MRSQTSAPARCLAITAALLLRHGVLMAQVTANSYLTPSPPVNLYNNDAQCQRSTVPGTSIPDTIGIGYTCYNPQAPPESEISPGVAVPFTYELGSLGTLSGGTYGVCMSSYPAIANSSYAVDPQSLTYQQPSPLQVQVGATVPSNYCSGTVTFKAGATVSWPGGSVTLEASITSPKCWPAYSAVTWSQPPESCPNVPATAACPKTMVASGDTCVCPTGTTYNSSSDSCVNAPCTGQPTFMCSVPADIGYVGPTCQNGQFACASGAWQCPLPPPGYCGSGYVLSCTESGWMCMCEGGCGSCPIIIDTQNQGFHLTDWQHGVSFGFFPNSPPIQLAWTDASYANGWLALDRNGNGLIDNATELFGNITPQPPSPNPNGFLALAVFDDPANGGNGNGFIDPGDAVYPHLRVWIDANHDGVSQPDELKTLQEVGIFRIDLQYYNSPFVDRYGNQFRYRGTVWDDESHSRQATWDVFLVAEPKRK